MNRPMVQAARVRAEALPERVGTGVVDAIRRLESTGPSLVAQGEAFARSLQAIRAAAVSAGRSRLQWTVVLPVAFMWLTIGFAVEGYVSSGAAGTFLEYWADGAPPAGLNSFRLVAVVEAGLLLLGGLSIASRLGRGDEATEVELGVVESLLLSAGGTEMVGLTEAPATGVLSDAVPARPALSEGDLVRLQAVFDVWGEIEPAVAGFVTALRETPEDLQRQVAALTGAVEALERPVEVVVSAVTSAQRSVDDIARASADTVGTLVDLGSRGSTALEEALNGLLQTTRRLDDAMGPVIKTMMILRNVASLDGHP